MNLAVLRSELALSVPEVMPPALQKSPRLAAGPAMVVPIALPNLLCTGVVFNGVERPVRLISFAQEENEAFTGDMINIVLVGANTVL